MNIAALAAGLFSGLIGAMGLGGGAVLIIYLTVFTDTPQLKSQGINLLFFIPIAVCAVIIYAKQKKIDFKTVFPIALGGIAGAFLGILLAKVTGNNLLAKLFGAGLCFIGAKEVIQSLKKVFKYVKIKFNKE